MKYFVIGFNKSATTTIHELFLLNNIKSQHNNIWNLEAYDAFSDNAKLDIYKELMVKYPDAIFILNFRNIKGWVLSRVNHGIIYKTIFNLDKVHEWTWNWSYPISEEGILQRILFRNNHIKEVLNDFNDESLKDRLIILDIDNKDWIGFLCSELNLTKQFNIKYNTSNFLFNNIDNSDDGDNCAQELHEAKQTVDNLFLKIKDVPQYKCIIKESNVLDDLVKLYRNNINDADVV